MGRGVLQERHPVPLHRHPPGEDRRGRERLAREHVLPNRKRRAKSEAGVRMRDSKNPGRGVLGFDRSTWSEFLDGLKSGDLDRGAS